MEIVKEIIKLADSGRYDILNELAVLIEFLKVGGMKDE